MKDPKLNDEIRITLVAAAFPMPEENMAQRQEVLRRLLRESVSQTGDDLDVPASFGRKQFLARRDSLVKQPLHPFFSRNVPRVIRTNIAL